MNALLLPIETLGDARLPLAQRIVEPQATNVSNI